VIKMPRVTSPNYTSYNLFLRIKITYAPYTYHAQMVYINVTGSDAAMLRRYR